MAGNMISANIPVALAQTISNDEPLDISIPIAEPAIEIIIKSEPESSDDWGYMNIGYGIDSRHDVHDMYMTVKRLDLIDWMKNYNPERDRYSENSDKIANGLNNNGHSGASYSGCLWVTSRVFKEGWSEGYTTNNW